MKAIELRTEYLKEALGIDIVKPRFYWKCEGGVKQNAYQIIAKKNNVVVWDSGKIRSNKMTHIPYEGPELNSRDRIEWSVVLWDEFDTKGEPVTTWFEIGLLNKTDWQAQWISGDYTPEKNKRYPVDHFQKKFKLNKKIKKARLYITACGLYEARINGERVGEFELAPGCTDYRHRIQYQTYDIESMLDNENSLEIRIADGWYRGSIGCFGPTNVFGRQTKLLLQLEIEYIDGKTEKIISDESFMWSNDGPLQFADLKDGEIVDASLKPSFKKRARIVNEAILPTASNNVAIKKQEKFTAKLLISPTGEKILDFGQNIAGFISFSIKGKKGQKVKIKLGEILDENGEFTQENFQKYKPEKEFSYEEEILMITGNSQKISGELVPTPKQEIEYLCSGNEDFYESTFTISGFRYAKIETDVPFKADQFNATAIYSDMEQIGSFECSNKKVNRLLENTRWSMKGNFADIPTDCPTRERLGWTGDGQIFFNTAAYLMNIAPFYRKWLLDFADGQFENGKISAVIPYAGMDMIYNKTGESVGWADAMVLIPYRFWKWYGDEEIIRTFYPQMKKYAQFLIENTGMLEDKKAKKNPYNKYTYEKGFHLGEWLEPKEFRQDVRTKRVHTEICTAYLHLTMKCMAEIANKLERKEDFTVFMEFSEGAKNAYEYLFIEGNTFETDHQAEFVRPLAFQLTTEVNKKVIAQKLVEKIQGRNYRIGTGFLSTPFILPVLSDNGHVDIAYKMLENEVAPSWLSQVNEGATTVWEDWEGKDSHNHYSTGSVCEWLFSTVGGIQQAGEKHFRIKPQPGGSLTFANTELNSLYGRVATTWKKKEGGYELTLQVPSNCTADVVLAKQDKRTFTSGIYHFEF